MLPHISMHSSKQYGNVKSTKLLIAMIYILLNGEYSEYNKNRRLKKYKSLSRTHTHGEGKQGMDEKDYEFFYDTRQHIFYLVQ